MRSEVPRACVTKNKSHQLARKKQMLRTFLPSYDLVCTVTLFLLNFSDSMMWFLFPHPQVCGMKTVKHINHLKDH